MAHLGGIGKGEFLGLDKGMQGLGAVEAHPFQVEAFEEVEHLQRGEALKRPPWEHGAAAGTARKEEHVEGHTDARVIKGSTGEEAASPPLARTRGPAAEASDRGIFK